MKLVKETERSFGVLGLRIIPVDDICRPVYQRLQSKKHIKDIIDNFDERLFDPLRVCWRNGSWYCYDGLHRHAAAMSLGYKELPCLVTEVISLEEEAMLFVKANTVASSRPLTPYAEIWAGIIGKDKQCLKLHEVVKESGFELGSGKNGITAIRRLQRCLDLYGDQALMLALKLIKEVYPDDTDAKKAMFIEGLTRFIKKSDGDMKYISLANALRKKTVGEINSMVDIVGIYKGMDRYVYVFHQVYGDPKLKIAI